MLFSYNSTFLSKSTTTCFSEIFTAVSWYTKPNQMTDMEHTIFTEEEKTNKAVLHRDIFEVLKNKDIYQDPKQQDVFLNNLQASV